MTQRDEVLKRLEKFAEHGAPTMQEAQEAISDAMLEIQQLHLALSAEQVVVPDGWQLVPKVSNRTMTMHACDSLPSCEHVFGLSGALCANVYARMLEAAPSFTRHDRASTDIVEGDQS